jgi:DNA-binding response OmpR family regulator
VPQAFAPELEDAMPFPRHILVVEDNASLRCLFVDVLSAERDLLVDGAGSIAEAEALLSRPEANYDAILLDLGLPDGDGRDLCLQLRRSGLLIPIIMLTGSTSSQDMSESLECGANDYIIKPVRMVELVVRLRAQLPALDHSRPAAISMPQCTVVTHEHDLSNEVVPCPALAGRELIEGALQALPAASKPRPVREGFNFHLWRKWNARSLGRRAGPG